MGFNFFVLLAAIPGYCEPWGKDADLQEYGKEIVVEERIELSPLAKTMEQIILFHQNVISPIDGPRSHYKPSSSGYMLEAIRKYDCIKGYIMGCDRLLRENGDLWVYRTTVDDNKIWKFDPPP
jgi:uncharacterized protein